MKNKINYRYKKFILGTFVLGMLLFMVYPLPRFKVPYSTLVTSSSNKLLSAQIASDGQWRFPMVDSIPEQLIESILFFEDEYFYYHPGVNPVSIVRALKQNVKSGRVISGGSTLSMQVVRLLRGGKKRSYGEKIIEVCIALKLDLLKSKQEILKLYVSHAPYGGNVVGVEAASWRYFNRPLHMLSDSEYALLAVLPNAPSLMHPGKNREKLLKKRNRLLKKLQQKGKVDSMSYSLSAMESIPDKPNPLPNNAYHLLDFAKHSGFGGKRTQTTIDEYLQRELSNKLDRYTAVTSQNEIRNACAMVISIATGEVKAYIGNSRNSNAGARYVDVIQAPRSSGSILKPFLYGRAIEEGLIHPNTLLRDVPVSLGKFSPSNFDKQFEGVVPAKEALARSLNIPATFLLRDYGIVPFYEDLQQLGFTTINRHANNYGLTLILGGAEVSLWELAKLYSFQAMSLRNYYDEEKKVENITLWQDGKKYQKPEKQIGEGAWWLLSEALTEVKRPELEKHWKRFSASQKIAWKTGTSHGFRDAWAVGYNADYLVAVWLGNAEGEGRPGLTGVSTAAPLMFEYFQYLNSYTWFEKPEMTFKKVALCATSGKYPGPDCPIAEVDYPLEANMKESCQHHKSILLNENGERVYRHCGGSNVRDTVWFSLDPVASYYYHLANRNYRAIPGFAESCRSRKEELLDVIYPSKNAEIIVPKNLSGKHEKVLFEATHTTPNAQLYWHLDNVFLGLTKGVHQIRAEVSDGKHRLLIMDEMGNSVQTNFEAYR